MQLKWKCTIFILGLFWVPLLVYAQNLVPNPGFETYTSPNGDNVNDLFVVEISDGIKVSAIEGIIYDRWGDVVYSSTDIPFSWNGQFNNQKVLPGVYVYVLNISYEFNTQVIHEQLTGDITLIH